MTAILKLDIAETIDDFKFGAKVKSEKSPPLANKYKCISQQSTELNQMNLYIASTVKLSIGTESEIV